MFTYSAMSLLQVALSSMQRQQIGVGCSTSLCWALLEQPLQVISTKVLTSCLIPGKIKFLATKAQLNKRICLHVRLHIKLSVS